MREVYARQQERQNHHQGFSELNFGNQYLVIDIALKTDLLVVIWTVKKLLEVPIISMLIPQVILHTDEVLENLNFWMGGLWVSLHHV